LKETCATIHNKGMRYGKANYHMQIMKKIYFQAMTKMNTWVLTWK